MAFIIKSYCDNGTTTFASDQRRGTMLKYAHFWGAINGSWNIIIG